MSKMDDVRKEMMLAMKNKNKVRKDALSSLLAAMKAVAIDSKDRSNLSDADADAVVQKEIRQLRETMESAPEDRVELLEECRERIKVLEEFAPKMMDADEIKEVIAQVLKDAGIENPSAKDKGVIMKNLMPKVKGKADGKMVNQLVSEILS